MAGGHLGENAGKPSSALPESLQRGQAGARPCNRLHTLPMQVTWEHPNREPSATPRQCPGGGRAPARQKAPEVCKRNLVVVQRGHVCECPVSPAGSKAPRAKLSWVVRGSCGDKGRLHPPGTPAPWGPPRECGVGLPLPADATMDAALHVPSLPAWDKQDLNPGRDSSVVTTLCVVGVFGETQVGASLAPGLEDPDSP